jgi:hypothetical protein
LKAQHGIGFRLARMEFCAFGSARCTRERAKLTANVAASASRLDAVVQSLFSGCLAAIHVESDSSLTCDAQVLQQNLERTMVGKIDQHELVKYLGVNTPGALSKIGPVGPPRTERRPEAITIHEDHWPLVLP